MCYTITLKILHHLTNNRRLMSIRIFDFEALRQKVYTLKDRDVNKVMEQFHRFKKNAEESGAFVYQAKT